MGDFHTTSMCRFMVATQAALWPLATAPAATRHRRMQAMKFFRDFLANYHITNVATDSYTLDWSKKTITITAYAETKDQSRLIDEYIENSDLKCKRVISKH